jgi:hypothetical protein
MLYLRSKWSDTIELLGWIFVTIIIYVVNCELIWFSKKQFLITPNDVSMKHGENREHKFLILGFSLSISMRAVLNNILH